MRKFGLPGITLVPFLAFSPVLLSACGDASTEESTRIGDASLNVSIASALGAFDNVELIRLTITETNSDGDTLAGPWTYARDLQRNGNVWTTTVGGVPLGYYRVHAEAKSAFGEALFAGSDTVHVSSDTDFQMTIILQEDVDTPVFENGSPLFVSVTANKANVNHDDVLQIRVGATDPDGNTGLQLVGGTSAGSDGTTAYFVRTWTPDPTDHGQTRIMLELTDTDGNRSAMSITVNVGGTGAIDATMVVNLAPTIESLTANVDTAGAPNPQGHYSSTILSLRALDGDYYEGTKGESDKKQENLTYAWSIENGSACTGSFNGDEGGTLPHVELGSSNGYQSISVRGSMDVRFTLLTITDAAGCWLSVVVTDQWLGTASARIQLDTSRVQPFYVPNLQVSIQSHDEITEIASGLFGGLLDGTFDRLQFEVYADGVPDDQEANIEWTWTIAGKTVPKYDAPVVNLLMDILDDYAEDAVPEDVNFFYDGILLKSAAYGVSFDYTQNRAYSTLMWHAWQKVDCYAVSGVAFANVVATAAANGVSDSITFPVNVDAVRSSFCKNNASL